jgi:hypothetical protein
MTPSLVGIGIPYHVAKKVLLIAVFGFVTCLLFTQAVGASILQQELQQQHQPTDAISYVPVPMVVPFDVGSIEENETSSVEGNSVNPSEPSMIQAATCNKFTISSVTADDNDGNVPSNVLDNNLDTRWSSNGIGSWIQLDLGSKKSICSVDIAWYRGTVRQNNFVISVSSDGTNFANKFSGQSSGNTLALEKYNLPAGTEGRYIRITVNGNTENNWASITEIAAHGGPVSTGTVKGTLYHKWQASPSSSNSWSVWKDIGGGGRGDPVVAQNKDGRLEVFAVDLVDNYLWHQWQKKAGDSQSWSGWTRLGSTITIKGDPIIAKNTDGRLEIFAVNAANNQLYHKWQTIAGNSNSWSIWHNIGSAITIRGEPVIASNSDGRLEVFVVNAANNQVYHKWQTFAGSSNSWSAWKNLGSAITIRGDPVIGKNSDGRLEVFAVQPDGGSANQPPTADSKSITTSTNTAVDITLSGKDPENGPLTFALADLPKSGRVAAIAGTTDKVRYTPNTGFTGSDSFTYTAKDNKGAVSAKATVSISVTSGGGGGGGDAGQNDKFGIKKIYASKPNGEQWFMNMADPSNDPRTSEPSMSRNSDGSWRVTSGQVRYGVFTSSGYLPDQVEKDHSVIASRGYMQSPNDWKNVEMTGQVKYNSGGDDEWTWYARGGRHTGSGWEDGCEGVALKGSLAYSGGDVRWAKEQWHVSYVFQPWRNSPADADGKFVGFKVAIYNMQLNGETVVKMESWVDPNNNNQWQKVYDFIDQGGWGSEGEECNGEPDQIVTWGGPIASFRWDDGNSIDVKNLSVREIVPPSQ